MRRAIVVGYGCYDLHAEGVTQIPRPGKLVAATGMDLSLGGQACNTGFTLAKLGNPVQICFAHGDDAMGAAVDFELNRLAATFPTDHVRVQCLNIGKTSGSMVLPYTEDRAFIHYPGSNAEATCEDLHPNFGDCSMMHFGYPALMPTMSRNGGAETIELFGYARDNGVVTSLDHVMLDESSWAADFDWLEYHQNVLPLTDIFCPSIEELCRMLFPASYQMLQDYKFEDVINPVVLADYSQILLALGAKIVLLKLGKYGLYLRTGEIDINSNLAGVVNAEVWSNREFYIQAIAAKNPKTTGAGDAAIAGFLASANKGLPPWQALEIASAAAACCCQQPDATSGIKNWAGTIGMLEMPQEPALFDLDKYGFHPIAAGRVYTGPNDIQQA